MPAAIDLTGLVFGRLTILRFVESRHDGGGIARRIYAVRCECGTEKELPGDHMKSGRVISCGCANREIVTAMRTKHGHAQRPGKRRDTSEYRSWRAMNERCSNPKSIGYVNYGGRGITVCQAWRESFQSFLADMGLKPTPQHTIDRINNDGNYEPGNCQWATRSQQNSNKRRGSRPRSVARPRRIRAKGAA